MLATRSAHVDYNSLLQGSLIEGSFEVASIEKPELVLLEGNKDLFGVSDPVKVRMGYEYRYRITSGIMGEHIFRGTVAGASQGTATFRFNCRVVPCNSDAYSVLFCETPYTACADLTLRANLRHVTQEIGLVQQATYDLAPHDHRSLRAIVLQQRGLQAAADASDWFHAYLAQGGKAIILANYFMRDSVSLANSLIQPYGLSLEDREYEELVCNASSIEKTASTQEVNRLYFFRPSPILARGDARIVVRHPHMASEGLVGCSGPHQNLYVVGQSLLSSLLNVGWPFDNGRLFANLLSMP